VHSAVAFGVQSEMEFAIPMVKVHLGQSLCF